jgi:hypothetical protein
MGSIEIRERRAGASLKSRGVLSLGLFLALLAQGAGLAQERQASQPSAARPRTIKTPSSQVKAAAENKPTASQAQNRTATQEAKPTITATDLVEQGKQQYRAANSASEVNRVARFERALDKFKAALQLESTHDEALGLAAITAFRLDNQTQARAWFLQRAELPDQKDSVKAYSYYWAALTLWRQAHDLTAKSGEFKEGKTLFALPEGEAREAAKHIADGLDYVGRALAFIPNYAEAHNLKNLLHTEAAFAAPDEETAAKAQRAALASLRKAIELYRPAGNTKDAAAIFGAPTIRVAEFARTKDEDAALKEPVLKMLEGGRPLTRVAAVFPAVRPPKAQAADPKDPSVTGVTAQGGAYSLGAGRGALNAAYMPGTVKVEVLVSTTGSVLFAHVVDGRSDLVGAALLAARKWTFAPAKFEGHPVQVSGVITFEMKPPGAKPATTPAPAAAKKQKSG